MEFAAWMEAYLGGRRFTFDPRNNGIRFGRILVAQGRDAAGGRLKRPFANRNATVPRRLAGKFENLGRVSIRLRIWNARC